MGRLEGDLLVTGMMEKGKQKDRKKFGEQPDNAPKPEGSLEVGVKVRFLDVL